MPTVQFVPAVILIRLPTSAATKLCVALVTAGEALVALLEARLVPLNCAEFCVE